MNSTPGLPVPPKPCRTCAKPTTLPGQRCEQHTQQHNRKHNQDTAHYRTPAWRTLRTHIIQRDYQQCIVCTSTHRLAVHHIHARKDGGLDHPNNLATLCHSCHSKLEAGNRDVQSSIDQYMRTIGE